MRVRSGRYNKKGRKVEFKGGYACCVPTLIWWAVSSERSGLSPFSSAASMILVGSRSGALSWWPSSNCRSSVSGVVHDDGEEETEAAYKKGRTKPPRHQHGDAVAPQK